MRKEGTLIDWKSHKENWQYWHYRTTSLPVGARDVPTCTSVAALTWRW